jgi:hypothetical protein
MRQNGTRGRRGRTAGIGRYGVSSAAGMTAMPSERR